MRWTAFAQVDSYVDETRWPRVGPSRPPNLIDFSEGQDAGVSRNSVPEGQRRERTAGSRAGWAALSLGRKQIPQILRVTRWLPSVAQNQQKGCATASAILCATAYCLGLSGVFSKVSHSSTQNEHYLWKARLTNGCIQVLEAVRQC